MKKPLFLLSLTFLSTGNSRQIKLTLSILLGLVCGIAIFPKQATAQSQNSVAIDDTFTVHGNTLLPSVLVNDIPFPSHYNFISASVQTSPSNGTLTGAFLGRWNYKPNQGFTGTDSFTYRACTSSSCSNVATVTLNVVNQAPVATGEFYVIGKGAKTTIGPLFANDYDSDDPFPSAYGPELVQRPVHGTLYGTGTIDIKDFWRNDSYTGYDYFTYRVRDPQGLYSNTATVSLFLISDDQQQDAGVTACQTSVHKPVNVTNGNMYLQQTDYVLPGIGEAVKVTRTYNSIIQTSGFFGTGWSTLYDEQITQLDDYLLRLKMADGKAVYFGRNNLNSEFFVLSAGTYGQIGKNVDGTFTMTLKDGRIHSFNSLGQLTSLTDRNNNQTTLTYDTNNHLVSVIDSDNRTLTVSTDTAGRITLLNDSIGTIAAYAYGVNGQLNSVTYADGSKFTFGYITQNNRLLLTEVKDALNNILEKHEYYTDGKAKTSEVDGGKEKHTLVYNSSSLTTVTDALGRVSKYTISKIGTRNVVTKIEGVCGCGGGSNQNQLWEYDAKLNVTKKTDGNGRLTNYTYDGNGNKLTETNATGTKTFSYNSFGQVLTANDQMNGVTTVTYNAGGNPTELKDALNNTTNFTYNALGQIQTVTDARNKTTSFTWTGANLTKQTDANFKETNFVYDNRGRLQTATNALGFVTTYEYDLNNRIKKIIYPDAKFEEFTYDLAGRRTQAKDARGNITTFGYDNAYRLTSVTDALSHATTFGYDLMSNRTSLTDALNNTTNYEYDDFNRLKKTIYPPAVAGGTRLAESIEYDLVGNVKKRIDTANRETLYDYDTAHRLIKTTDALSQITQFEYNARSQMTKVKDALNQEYVFTYDALGRQLSQTRAGTTMSYEHDAVGNRTKRTDYTGRVTDYTYDNLNRLTTINYINQSSADATYAYDDLSRLISAANDTGTVTFTYNNRNQVTASTDVFARTVEYGYDENGNRNLLKLDGTTHATYVYDVANRLTTLTDEASQNFTFGYDITNRLISKTLPNSITTTYDYDGISRLTRLKHQSQAVTLTDNNFAYNTANQISQIAELAATRNFAYDNIDRLTNMTSATLPTENYAFDTVGNRTSSHQSSTYSYQSNNKLISTANVTYAYDANGNMTSKTNAAESWTYAWDYENRMTSATSGTNSVSYNYDALGRRVKRTEGANETKYTYDGLDVVMDDENGVLTKYQNGLGIDDKLKMVTNGQAKYFLQDHLGSTTALTDSGGNITSSANYDSFGNSANNLTTRYQYTGREFDSFTGLYFYRARWYDANLGRFISEDPIGFAGGDVNLFAYVGNKPLINKDPSGRNPYEMLRATNEIWKLIEPNLCQDIAPDFIQGSVGIGGASGTISLTRDGDIFVGWEGNPFDSGRMMFEGFRGGKVGFGFSVTAQKIFRQGRLSREDRRNIVGGTSFSGNAGYDFMVSGQMSPTDNMGNIYSGGFGLGAGFNFGLGGGQSYQPEPFDKPLRLPIRWGALPPPESGKCDCANK